MKKILSILILAIALSSCSTSISDKSSDIFQGVKDNVFWEGSNAAATKLSSTKLAIQAVTLSESMTLTIPVPPTNIDPKNKNTFKTYVLGTTATQKATYETGTADAQVIYETGIGVGDGQVVVSKYDGVSISGTFRFNAINTDPSSALAHLVNLQNGYFYNVPVTP